MGTSKEDFCRHLSRLGFEIGAPREWVEQKFRRQVGEERYANLVALSEAADDPDLQNRAYEEFSRDTVEANLFRSRDPDVTVETSYHLYRQCLSLLSPGKRVLELACWTGGLSSFIALNHPRVEVAGVDRVERVIGLNRAQHQLSNLTFQKWDYRHDKPPKILPADVLLCGLGIINSPDGGYDERQLDSVRDSRAYRNQRSEALVYFRNWRSAARDGATLIAVLRMTTFGRFVAFVDAAREAGWTAELGRWTNVFIPSKQEMLPSLVFTARPSQEVPEDVALAFFTRLTLGTKPYLVVYDGLALSLFRAMQNKRVLQSVHYRSVLGFPSYGEVAGPPPINPPADA